VIGDVLDDGGLGKKTAVGQGSQGHLRHGGIEVIVDLVVDVNGVTIGIAVETEQWGESIESTPTPQGGFDRPAGVGDGGAGAIGLAVAAALAVIADAGAAASLQGSQDLIRVQEGIG
jgi:hypothetical protein